MPTDIFIIGTSHPLQCGNADCSEESIDAFESELRIAIDKRKIKRIAEEMNAVGLRRHKVSETIAQRLANEVDIPYQAVDLSEEERKILALDEDTIFKTMKSFRIEDGGPLRRVFDDLADGIRERVWIARILSQERWPILFVCGAEHSVSFRRLWSAMSFDARIIHIDFQP